MTHTACYIAISGSAFYKASSPEEAIRGVLAETAFDGFKSMSIWRLRFPQPVDNLDRVNVDAAGGVTYPVGSVLTKFEKLPIPPAVSSAALAFENAMQDWRDDVLDGLLEEPIAA